jgi:predicted Fe-Mo cluster-binding NifX family protein
MRVAVAIFGTRASPRAECCTAVLLAEVGGGRAQMLGTISGPGIVLADRAAALRRARVEVLVCGGITMEAADALRAAGIHVISEVRGEAEEILRDLATGKLPLEAMTCAAGAK